MNAAELLKKTRVEVSPETYHLVGLTAKMWENLLESPESSPRADAVYMIWRTNDGVTILVDDGDWTKMRHLIGDAKHENGFRLLTFKVALDWNVVGYLALITRVLAEAKIPCGVVSSFEYDHLLVKQENLGAALIALREYVEELC